ncbi:MAG: gentisate 1,2-dioxygenase [Acidobacteriota bacterium]
MEETRTIDPDRKAFYEAIDPLNMAPLWEAFHDLITPEPSTPCVPFLWAYDRVRPYLMESGQLISAEEAERRVLILENPALRGHSSVTHTLYAGLQLVLPREVAPCHRHSQSALRLIIEGSGAHTSVDGERIFMEKGDFIITGAWSWHDHANESSEPVVWLDGLDIPLVKFFDASFIERYSDETHPELRPPGDNSARYGVNMKPVGYEAEGRRSPLFSYPYARSREALERMRRLEEWDPHHGLKMEFINPADGGPAMPTISTFIQLFPKSFSTEPYRSTDSAVYTVIEGSGETVIGGAHFSWKPRDVFVVPSWYPHHHHADEESVLFSYSDRVVQQKLGLWRESKEKA